MLKIHKYASNTNTNTHGKTRNTQIQKYRHTQIQILPLALLKMRFIIIYPLEKTAVTFDPEIKKRLPVWQINAISQETKPLCKMESVRKFSRGVNAV